MAVAWWDYVTGSAAVLAAVAALVSVQYARKASRDVVDDRRATHELDLLVKLYELIAQQPRDFLRLLALYARALPDELPAIAEWIAGDKAPVDDGSPEVIFTRSAYVNALKQRAFGEILEAMRSRTRESKPPRQKGRWAAMRLRYGRRGSATSQGPGVPS